ncbi:MAG: TolC family protein [Polyangia bacterium]
MSPSLMRRGPLALLVLGLGLAPGAAPCAAAPPPPPAAAAPAPMQPLSAQLTLAQLLAELEATSPALRRVEAEARAAAERPAQARTLEDPMLMLELWQVPTSVAHVPLMITLRQPLPWPGKLRARAAALEPELARARAEAALTARDLRLAATRGYYDYLFSVRSLAALATQQRLLAGIVAAAEIRYRVGRAELAELLKAQEDAASLDNLVLDVEQQRDVTVAALNTLLARPPEQPLGTPVTLPEVRPLPALAQLTERALAVHPVLRGARAGLLQAQAREHAARLERAPDLALWAGYMAMLRGGGDGTFTVGVQTSLPSLSLLGRGAAVREAAARVSGQRAALAETEARLRGELRQALLRTESAERHIRLHEQTLVPTAERAVRAAQAGYQNGRVPLVLLLDAARALVQHQLDHARYLTEYGQRLAELEAAVGEPLPEGGRP